MAKSSFFEQLKIQHQNRMNKHKKPTQSSQTSQNQNKVPQQQQSNLPQILKNPFEMEDLSIQLKSKIDKSQKEIVELQGRFNIVYNSYLQSFRQLNKMVEQNSDLYQQILSLDM